LRDAYLMQAGGAGNMATLCCTVLWQILDDARLLEGLQQEFGQLDPMVMMQSGIARMPFTRALILECERCFPLTPGLPKLALREVQLLDYTINEGEEVIHFFTLAHFLDEEFADPLRFWPARWMQEGKPNRPHAFGGGEHICIGMNLSYLFIVMTLQVLLGKYVISAESAPYMKEVSQQDDSPLRTAFDIKLR
jgi:cytochrome P450